MNSSVINCTILITILIHPRRLYKILQTWKSFVYRGPRSTCDFERRKSREDVHRLLVNDPTKNDLNIVYLDPWDTHVLKLPAKQAFFISFLISLLTKQLFPFCLHSPLLRVSTLVHLFSIRCVLISFLSFTLRNFLLSLLIHFLLSLLIKQY